MMEKSSRITSTGRMPTGIVKGGGFGTGGEAIVLFR